MNEFPVTINAALTLVGMVVIAGLLTEWVKQFVPQGPPEGTFKARGIVVNSLCLVLSLGLAALLQAIQSGWTPTAAELADVLLTAFVACSVATFGYEIVANLVTMVKPG